MENKKDYLKLLTEYRDTEVEVLRRLDMDSVNQVLKVLEEARIAGRHFFICGNGGSAATASHYAGDFNKGVNMGLLGIDGNTVAITSIADQAGCSNIPLYNFECLSDNIPTLMAVANDESYAEAFRYPLSVKMRKGDIVIGISASGNSTNVINALEYCKRHGGIAIAIVGYEGGSMKQLADYCIHVNINDMQISEDIHMFLDHMMMWVLTHRSDCEE